MASASPLNELAPGRIRLGLGVGDSGPLNLGVPRTGLARQGRLAPEDAAALAKLQAAHDQGHLWEPEHADLVPERWIDLFAIAGTPDEVRIRLEQAVETGAEEISMILMGPPPRRPRRRRATHPFR